MNKKELSLLTVIIGTYNRIHLLQRCLKTLDSLKVAHEIFVLDAGSTDGTKELIRKSYKHIYLKNDKKRFGQTKSFNAVLHNIQTKYICWLSDDNIIKSNVLDKAVNILEQNQEIGMVGLKVKDIKGPYTQEPYIGGIWPSGILNVNQGMIRNEVLRKIKYFDEKFPDYGMDADLTTKVLLAGFKVVYTKKIAIYHVRDYKNYPGAFQNQERNMKLQLAFYLYKKKYKKLCEHYIHKRMLYLESSLIIFRSFLSHIFGFRRFGFSLSKLIGYNKRDFTNVFEAQFISKLDLWYNRGKDFYLVQEIKKNTHGK